MDNLIEVNNPFGVETTRIIVNHFEAHSDQEACCLVLNDGRVILTDNTHEEPKDHFSIDTKTFMKVYSSGRLAAVVHSHIYEYDNPMMFDTSEGPSAKDIIQQKEMLTPWGIGCVVNGQMRSLTYWGDSLPILPYEHRQFVDGAYDCYRLVRDWYRQELGIILEDFPRDNRWWEDGYDLVAEILAATPQLRRKEVGDIQRGDILVFSILSSLPNHSSIYLGDGKLLHHKYGKLSNIEDVSRWMEHLEYVMRYEA